MDYKKTASEVVENIGGKDNINHMEYCSTCLRFTLKSKNYLPKDELTYLAVHINRLLKYSELNE